MPETKFNVGGIPTQALLSLVALTVSIGGGYAGQRYAAGEQWGKIQQNAERSVELQHQIEEQRTEMRRIKDSSISKDEFDRLMKQLDRMERDTQQIREWILNRRN